MNVVFRLLLLLTTSTAAAYAQGSNLLQQTPPAASSAAVASNDRPAIGDEERSALVFTRYDLDVHLNTAASAISVVARVSVRNDGAKPLSDLPLQISSTLQWDGVSLIADQRTEKLSANTHLLQSDADSTGQVSEAIIALPKPLAVGGTAELTVLYSGHIGSTAASSTSNSSSVPVSGDIVTPDATYLRGFGHTLWYPSASPQVFYGEGANLPRVEGRQMLLQATAPLALRLTVEFTGDQPKVVFFSGRRQILTGLHDDADAPIADSLGVATAMFPAKTLGFRTPSLVVTRAPIPVPGTDLALISDEEGEKQRLSSLAPPVDALLGDWFGQKEEEPLTIVDHPGSPFADTGLLLLPLGRSDDDAVAEALLPALTHLRFRSPNAWLDQGAAQFSSWLWLEHQQGRSAVLASLSDASHALALAESVETSTPRGDRGLLTASEPLFYRTESASILWMLRDIAGDAALKQAFQRYGRDADSDKDSSRFQKLLEQASGKNLAWFFDDWVYHDRGLPELSIVSAIARPLPSKTANGAGRLVAVEIRNDGGASAEVPVFVRAGTLTAAERVRVNAHSVASVRILFQGDPKEVQVNDGTIPEMIESTHISSVAAD